MNLSEAPIKTEFLNGLLVGYEWVKWINSIRRTFLELFTIKNELKIKVYEQDDEPALSENRACAIWIDTNDSNKTYLIFKNGTNKKIELT